MEWSIQSLQSVGPVRFGMSRADVRLATGAPFYEFRKASAVPPIDVFETLLLHAHYDPDDRVEFVEFGGGKAAPIFRGRNLLATPFGELRDWLRTLDPEIEVDGAGLRSRKLGVALYAPAGEDEPHRLPEGASAFAAGYYERHSL